MGGGASAMAEVHLDEEVNPAAWLTLHFVTDNGVRFNSRTISICGVADNSLLQRNDEVIHNKGYWWEHDHVPTEKDDDDNLNEVLQMTPNKLKETMYLINQSGLKSSYSEHFACPREISPDSIFVTIRFVVESKSKRHRAITSLSGCIKKEELNVPFVGCSDKATRGAWIYRARELLPGPRFDHVQADIRDWWNQVEKLCEAAATSEDLTRCRAEYISLATKRSQAYAHALQSGTDTVKGAEHIAMADHWTSEGERALVNVSKCLLDRLFDEGKVLVAAVVKDKAQAFEKLESLKQILHDEFMTSLLALGDQIQQHEHDAWTSFHQRFSKNRPGSASSMTAPSSSRPVRQNSMLVKKSFSLPSHKMVIQQPSKRVVVVEDDLLGSSKKYVDVNCAREEDGSVDPSSAPSSSPSSPSSSPSLLKKSSSQNLGKQSSKRVGLAPLAEQEEHKTDKNIEDRVKTMVLTMTATATQNTTKAKLTQRLALVKAQKTRQQNEAFVIGAKAHFECLLFDLCINAKMLDYMERERAVLENKIFNQITTVKKAQSIKHSKDLGLAIREGRDARYIQTLEADLQKRKDRLHNKLNHRKLRKRQEFDDAKAITLEKLREKIDDINVESTTAALTATACAKLKGISLIYKLLQARE